MVWLDSVLVRIAQLQGSQSAEASLNTSELGDFLGVSQQTASRYLQLLEEKGWLARARSGRGFSVKLTDEGVDALRQINISISSFLQSGKNRAYSGEVVSGIGEGAYYVGEYSSRINGLTGYVPYPGTFNLRVEGGRPDFRGDKTVAVEEFTSGERTFGKIWLTPVTLKIKGKNIECHILLPDRTHHKQDIELICGKNIRKTYNVTDGDTAEIRLK